MKKLFLFTLLGFLSGAIMAQAVNTLDEDFEEGIPAEWTIINANEGAEDNGDPEHTWYYDDEHAFAGSGCIALDTHPGPADDYLVTPLVKLSDGFVLRFWAKASSSYPDDLSILVSKTGTAAGDFTIDVMSDSTISGGYDFYEFTPTDHAELSDGEEVYMAFYVGTHGSYFDLDEVYYGEVIPRIMISPQTVTNAAGETVIAQSTESTGSIYLVLDGEPQSTTGELDNAVAASRGAKATVSAAEADVTISTEGLEAGVYYAYAVDGDGTMSEKSYDYITIKSATETAVDMIDEDFEDGMPVTWTIINANEGANDNGDPENTWYLADSYGRNDSKCAALDTYPGPADDWFVSPLVKITQGYILSFWWKASSSYPDNLNIMASKTGKEVADFTITLASQEVSGGYTYFEIVPSDNADLADGDEVYLAFHVDSEGSFFDIDDIFYGEEPIKINMAAQTVDNGAGSTVNAQSNFGEGSLYIVLDGEPQSTVAELDAAVAAGKGATASVDAADTDITLSAEGLAAGLYYGYAVDAEGNLSDRSDNAVTIQEAAATAVEDFMVDFESGIPVDWTIVNANEGDNDNGDSDHTWTLSEGNGVNGSDALYLDTHPGPADDWFISPLTKLKDGYMFSVRTSGSTQYPDEVTIYVSTSGKEIADFTLELGHFEVPGPFTNFFYIPTEMAELNDGDEVYFGIHCNTHGSSMYMDDIRYGEALYGSPQHVYNQSDDQLTILFDAPVGGGAEVASNWELRGSSTITFSNATIDAEDETILHLSGASATMDPDVVKDSIVNTGNNEYLNFYAGISPVAMANIAHNGGYLETFPATFRVIVMHKNLEDDGTRTCVADESAESGGVLVYGAQFYNNVSVGDEILIYCTVSPYQNQTELFAPAIVETISTGNDLFNPVVISGSDLDKNIAPDTNPAEKWEGTLVKVEGATVNNYTAPYFYLTDDEGATEFRVGNGLDLFLAPFGETSMNVGSKYDVTGFVVNRDGDYRLVPRDNNDIVEIVGIEETETAGLTLYPNPATRNIRIRSDEELTLVNIYTMTGRKAMEKNLDGKTTIDIRSLDNGMYIVKARTATGKMHIGKLMKR